MWQEGSRQMHGKEEMWESHQNSQRSRSCAPGKMQTARFNKPRLLFSSCTDDTELETNSGAWHLREEKLLEDDCLILKRPNTQPKHGYLRSYKVERTPVAHKDRLLSVFVLTRRKEALCWGHVRLLRGLLRRLCCGCLLLRSAASIGRWGWELG